MAILHVASYKTPDLCPGTLDGKCRYAQGLDISVQLICAWRAPIQEQRRSSRPLPLIRVLVVDDFEDWRRQVRLLLQARPEWQVIAEASDGSEAVQKAEDLKPDLILLDIGLPKLNGIEAARRIRQVSPSSKIIFLSQDNDPEIVQAALSTGARVTFIR